MREFYKKNGVEQWNVKNRKAARKQKVAWKKTLQTNVPEEEKETAGVK